ncbi:MAG: hypothetical protein R2860_06930 [Desulfobacterales bacterium]
MPGNRPAGTAEGPLSTGDWVAVKGSRSTGMEDIVNLMTPETPDA